VERLSAYRMPRTRSSRRPHRWSAFSTADRKRHMPKWCPPFGKGWAKPVSTKVATSSSNIAGRTAITIACRDLQMSWSIGASLFSIQAEARFLLWRPRTPLAVSSLNRPGGNATGVTLFTVELEAKRLELLRQLLPSLTVVVALINPSNPNAEDVTGYVQSAARALGLEVRLLHAASEAELDAVLGNLPQANAMLVGNDPFFVSQRAKIIAAAARNSLPAIYQSREFPASGGLASYGSNLADMYRKSGIYVGQVLKGIKPSDLPVQQPTAFELVINLKTAKALGLELPATLLASADEVIE
jgi:ABC transporter substrate binding protein